MISLAEHPQVSDFIAYLHLKNSAPATIKMYREVLKRLFDYVALGPSPPIQITAAQLRDCVANLYERELAPKPSGTALWPSSGSSVFCWPKGILRRTPHNVYLLPK
jgi:site-specific recombinase XerD